MTTKFAPSHKETLPDIAFRFIYAEESARKILAEIGTNESHIAVRDLASVVHDAREYFRRSKRYKNQER